MSVKICFEMSRNHERVCPPESADELTLACMCPTHDICLSQFFQKNKLKGFWWEKCSLAFFSPSLTLRGNAPGLCGCSTLMVNIVNWSNKFLSGCTHFFFFASAVLWHTGCSWWQRRTTGYFFHFIFLFCFYIVSTFGLSKYHPYDRESQDPI